MLLGVVLVAGGLLFAQVGQPIITPPQNTTTRTVVENHVDVTVAAPSPDMAMIAESSQQSFQAIFVNLVAPTLVSWVNGVLDVPDIARTTPPDLTYNNSGVRGLADQIKLAAGALLAVAIFANGVAYMMGQHASAGRVIYALLLSFGDLIWWQWGIDLNNAINAAISAPTLKEIANPHLTLPAITSDPVAAFGPAVLVCVYAVVLLLLLFSNAFRLGMLDILICVGPLALLCAATEQTSGLSSKYTTLAIGTLFSQVLIVVCLKLAPILGGLGTGIAGTLLGIVVLLLARRMPHLLASATNHSSGMGRMGMMMVARRVFLRH